MQPVECILQQEILKYKPRLLHSLYAVRHNAEVVKINVVHMLSMSVTLADCDEMTTPI